MLSFLATGDFDGHVPGIQDILDGYVDGNGTRHPSAAEMMARGDTALSAFRTYRENIKATVPTMPTTAATLKGTSATATSPPRRNWFRLSVLSTGRSV